MRSYGTHRDVQGNATRVRFASLKKSPPSHRSKRQTLTGSIFLAALVPAFRIHRFVPQPCILHFAIAHPVPCLPHGYFCILSVAFPPHKKACRKSHLQSTRSQCLARLLYLVSTPSRPRSSGFLWSASFVLAGGSQETSVQKSSHQLR